MLPQSSPYWLQLCDKTLPSQLTSPFNLVKMFISVIPLATCPRWQELAQNTWYLDVTDRSWRWVWLCSHWDKSLFRVHKFSPEHILCSAAASSCSSCWHEKASIKISRGTKICFEHTETNSLWHSPPRQHVSSLELRYYSEAVRSCWALRVFPLPCMSSHSSFHTSTPLLLPDSRHSVQLTDR